MNESTLKLISRIYDAGLSASHWPAILDDIAEHFDAVGAGILFKDILYPELDATVSNASSFWTRDGNQEYYEQHLAHLDPGAELIMQAQAGEIAVNGTPAAVPVEQRSPYEQAMIRRFGIYSMAAARLSDREPWLDLMTMQFGQAHGPLRESEKQEWGVLLPHIAKVMEISRPMNLLQKRFRAVLDALDRFHLGVLILSRDGKKILANQEADRMLSDGDGMGLDHRGVLRVSNSTKHEALMQLVAAAAMTASAASNEAGRLLSVDRRSGKDAYLIEIAPLTDPEGEIKALFHGAIAFLIDPDEPGAVSTRGMQELYGFTDAETEVCGLMVDGISYRDIAEVRGVSLETIKTQAKRMLGKSGALNRSELVRLALRVNLPIDS